MPLTLSASFNDRLETSLANPSISPTHHRPRIALIIDPWDYPFNGTVVSTRRFVSALRAQFNFTIFKTFGITPDDGDSDNVNFKKISVPGVNRIIDKMQAPIARPHREKIITNLNRCDLLHIQYPFLLAYRTIGIARRLGIPIVSSFHVQPENILRNLNLPEGILSEWLYRLFIKVFYQASDLVIAPSEFAKGLLVERGLDRPVEVLSNGVTQAFFDIERAPSCDHRFSILSVGRMAREKQQDLLIKAIGQSQYKDKIHLTLAGAGPLTAALRTLAKKEGVSADIGRVDDKTLMQLYGSTDLFVQCSQIELEGMSALEAMAAGCPTLLNRSKTSALAELVQNTDAEFSESTPETVARRIDGLLSNPTLREHIGAQNRSFARTRHHDRSIEQLAEIYNRVLSDQVPKTRRSATPNNV